MSAATRALLLCWWCGFRLCCLFATTRTLLFLNRDRRILRFRRLRGVTLLELSSRLLRGSPRRFLDWFLTLSSGLGRLEHPFGQNCVKLSHGISQLSDRDLAFVKRPLNQHVCLFRENTADLPDEVNLRLNVNVKKLGDVEGLQGEPVRAGVD